MITRGKVIALINQAGETPYKNRESGALKFNDRQKMALGVLIEENFEKDVLVQTAKNWKTVGDVMRYLKVGRE